ncbi:DUF6177 family protein [Streptomyces coffeae]|uniref:Uncharacterized protein n=1 Tax=Streptomyces coffeae TaxID=621382 RepID=A0ABS1NP96_9ACTN|nr:DUF6177 family protein [Streptomyces coffeae]MBL1101903.1 hypothetical protein [Streptomyces coffeae]
MTKDLIALTEKMPDPMAILMGLYAGGPDLGLQSDHEGAVIRLTTSEARPLMTIEAPIFIQVEGEVARLLGTDTPVPEGPVWWTEARASPAIPEAERLAASFAGRLNALCGGITWPPDTATLDPVELTGDTTALRTPDDDLPAVDVLTEKAAVVLTERPRVALTIWLADILRSCIATDRALQIVTPPTSRLTLPLRTALVGHPNRWVVQDDGCGYYDGLSGAVLRWQDGAFTPVHAEDGATPAAKPFTDARPTGERQLICTFRTRYTPDRDLTLGTALETAWKILTGKPPAGWSTAEPINNPWSSRQLTELARDRAPQPTWLTAVGHPDRPAMATIHITRTTAGVEEDITLTVGYGPDETLPLDDLENLATTLTLEHSAATLLACLRPARHDLTTSPHLEAPATPVAFSLGPHETAKIGLSHAMHPPLDLRPRQLGTARRSAVHYPLGDGSDVAAWATFQQLVRHLKTPSAEGRR